MSELEVKTKKDVAIDREPEYRKVTPDTDIHETADAFHLLVDLPGVREDSLELNVEDNVLSIRGRASPTETGGRRQHLYEYGLEEYSRSFQLPEGLDYKKVNARLKDGVLAVVLPKGEDVRPRKIKVKSA